MNKNFFAGLFIGLGLLAIVAFKPSADQPAPAVQKWEYHRIVYNAKVTSDPQIKLAGLQGWELVATGINGDYLFKRPAQ